MACPLASASILVLPLLLLLSPQDAINTLGDDDVERGFMLICSSHPVGPGLDITLNQQVRVCEECAYTAICMHS